MFSIIVSDRKSDMENRQAIRPEQRKLFPSDYFSRNFSLMIISLNCRIFTPAKEFGRPWIMNGYANSRANATYSSSIAAMGFSINITM